jgi:hypothetical protein
MDSSYLTLENCHRKFGVEIEVNALDSRDFNQYPLMDGEMPAGIEYIGEKIASLIKEPVDIRSWHYTHNNNRWVLKSDRSCGVEICSPVSSGKFGINRVCSVLDAINKDDRIPIDRRCSLHIHVNIADCSHREVATILGYWIKAEPVFIDFLPAYRKKSRYFQCIGAVDLFSPTMEYGDDMEKLLGIHKYFTINTYQKAKNKRPTIEFRIMGCDGCSSTEMGRNWIVLIMHFVEMALKKVSMNSNKSVWNNLTWMDPRQLMEFLGFMGDYELSSELRVVRKWFLMNLSKWTGTGTGFWGKEGRQFAANQVQEIISELQLDI